MRKIVGALALSLISAFALSVPAVAAASPALVGLSTAKVVIIVGPVGNTSTQNSYIADASDAAAHAREWSANVITIYSPHATWANVEPALQGASIVVYMGHGNGLTSPYHPTFDINNIPSGVDGLGLNPPGNTTNNGTTSYYGEATLAKYIKLAPNAVVIQAHLCYSAGNSEPGNPLPTLAVAKQRADNFTAGWLRTGARAVISEVYSSGMAGWYIDQIFSSHQAIDAMWRSARTSPHNVQAWPSARTAWSTTEIDPALKTGSDQYGRALGGDLTLTTDEVLASSSRSAFLRVTLSQSNPVGRSILGTTWVSSLRAQ